MIEQMRLHTQSMHYNTNNGSHLKLKDLKMSESVGTETEGQELRFASVDAVSISMHANPGVYALLLGAGISLNSGVPAAWDVKNELCKKLAICQGAGSVENGVSWYVERFGVEPGYSRLFEELSTSGVERVGLLKGYFEVNDEDLALGLKTPTDAHRAIARLVHRGFIRVIVTTNFDRLLESALRELGIEPVVISTDQDATIKPPFVHNRCTVFKIHGDYLDSTLRNTTDELSSYSGPLKRRLLQILDEYGIIVSGWSAESDVALREGLQSPDCQQYASFYWCTRKEILPDHAQSIVRHRGGHPVLTSSADEFFRTVADNVEGMEHMEEQRSRNLSLARARAVSYINDPSKRALYIDWITRESRRITTESAALFSDPNHRGLSPIDLLAHVENETLVLRTLLATGCFYIESSIPGVWKRCIDILLPRHNGCIQEDGISLYPALLAFYTIGVTANIRSHAETFKEVIQDLNWQYYNQPEKDLPVATLLYPQNVLDKTLNSVPDFQRMVSSGQRYLFSPHDRFQRIWGPVLEYCSSSKDFTDALTSLELSEGAYFIDQRDGTRWAPPLTQFLLSHRRDNLPAKAESIIQEAQVKHERGELIGLVELGVFNGDMDRYLRSLLRYREVLLNMGFNM